MVPGRGLIHRVGVRTLGTAFRMAALKWKLDIEPHFKYLQPYFQIMPQQQNNKETLGVIGFPFSKGQPRNGTEHGPNVLREAGIITSLQSLGVNVIDHGDIEIEVVPRDEPMKNVRNPRTVAAANKKLSDAVAKLVKMNQSVLALGGDHCMAIGSIHGHAQVEPNLVVVWVDAHADVNTPLTSVSGNIHGMPLSFLLKELEEFVPKVPGFEWCKPCLSVRDLVYIGLRDVDPAERLIIEKFGIHAYSMQEVDKYGIKEVVERALNQVDPSGVRPIHVSFDVDAMDPTLTPATGTPVSGGLSLRESFYLAEEISNTGRLSVLDIAEVNPLLSTEDKRKLTVINTTDVSTKFYGYRRQGNAPRDYELPKP
uniref:Arginase n=3 Tax=Biomphalaria glabrata TaxID=6526 RepID=A0A2C9M9J1_BIOGL